MTARELLLRQLADAENQVAQAIAGLDAEHAEARATEGGMTVREAVQHLAEAAVATLAAYEGRAHDFGTYAPDDRSWPGVKNAWRALRAEAVAKLPDDDASLWSAFAFLVGHDYYHVGQIAAARLAVHPEWDAFVIYRPAL